VNSVWGNSAAILGGDFLYSRSFQIAAAEGDPAFLDVLTRTTTIMAEGQIMELSHVHDWELTMETYMEIIDAKTAALISAACACGGIAAGAGPHEVDGLKRFGLNLGAAFQLVDDLLDYVATEKTFGKPVGKDLMEGKITLPLIYSLEQLEPSEIRGFQDRFKQGRAETSHHEQIIDQVRQSGALDRVRSDAEGFVTKAEDALSVLPDTPSLQNLRDLNRYLLERSF
jgi:octaprenyl-diphosphate synthase